MHHMLAFGHNIQIPLIMYVLSHGGELQIEKDADGELEHKYGMIIWSQVRNIKLDLVLLITLHLILNKILRNKNEIFNF